MDIQLSATTSTISLANLVRATSGQGKVSFPVNSSDIAFTNFKNIKTVPSGTGSSSYSVSRLRALDNLIEQLNRMKGQNRIETPNQDSLNSDTLNSLIAELSEKIHTRLDSVKVYKPLVESTGLLINMLL